MRETVKQWFDSLVNRAVALVVIVITLTAVTVTLINSQAGRQELEAQARAQVTAIAGLIARDLDEKLAERFEVLADVAASLTMEQVTFNQRAQLLVERQVALHHLFDDVFFFDQYGTVLSKYPLDASYIGTDASLRDYFRQSSSQLTVLVSEPFLSMWDNEPTVMMTAPVFDHKRRFIGVLGGAIALTNDNFMGQIVDTKLGKSGYVGIATRSGITLAHHRPSEVMQPLPSSNAALVEAIAGFEGTLFTESSIGEKTMISLRQMNQAPWFVGVVWPLAEAFAPVNRLTDIMVWVTLGIIIILAPIALLGFRRLLAPLAEINQQISDRHLGMRSKPVAVGGGREIRRVANTFNTVMEERTQVMSALAEREAFFRSLSQSAPIGIVQTDVLGRIDFVNPAFEHIVGRDQSELQGRYLISCVYDQDREHTLRNWRAALNAGEVFQGKFRMPDRQSGRLIWVDAMTSVIQTSDRSIGTITVTRDITHELAVEEQLRAEQERAEGILGALQEGVLLTNTRGMIQYANRAACGFVTITPKCMDCNFFDLLSIEVKGDHWSEEEFLARDKVESLEAVVTNRAGQTLDIELTMLRLNRGGEHECLVFVLRDDRERRRQEAQLSWEASHDSLTALFNRRAFNAHLSNALVESRVTDLSCVLMLIDLDYFKPVNDLGGHLVGDELLRRLALALASEVRQSDCVARIGGDEFGIILPGCSLARAEELAEHIRESVARVSVEEEGTSYRVTASIGLTPVSAQDASTEASMARADEGCYDAKARGRNTVVTVPLPTCADGV
ncbi:sensor domain-containing diguanylate cyclase [Marinobacter caseinilyticus]|uniref:sensor domain-containing diguanylate cyclase n=1 Tax=Marinobacter caseinilyticus TaxID=2692195 RepID=UPI00140DAE1E|nr:diguanylate cyclase [Marinobacter caseinilyticus]